MAVAALAAVALAVTGVGAAIAATSSPSGPSGHGDMSQMMHSCCGQASSSGQGSMPSGSQADGNGMMR